MRFKKTILALLSASVGLAGAVAAVAAAGPASRFSAAALAPDSTYTAPKSRSGALAQTEPRLLGRTDSPLVNVLIKYDFDPTASYTGSVAGLAPTSPSVTGKRMKKNRDAVRAYEQHVSIVANDISAGVRAAVPSVRIRKAFTTVYGGVAAQVPANTIGDLLRVPGVAAVQEERREKPARSSEWESHTGKV